MTQSHLDLPTILQLHRRELPYELEERALDHLADCAECRSRVEEAVGVDAVPGRDLTTADDPTPTGAFPPAPEDLRPEAPAPAISRSDYGPVLDNAIESLFRESAELETERSQVAELLRELDGLSSSQQQLIIRNSTRYQTWALVEGLLEACRAGWSDDPERSEGLAERALDVASCLSVSGFRQQLLDDLKAEAWSFIGNCRRIRSDLFAAEQAFRSAWDCLATGSGDPSARAGILDLESSLKRAMRDLPAAERLLSAAIGCYRELGDHHMEGRALLNVATCLWMRGELTESLAAMEEGSRLIDADREPTLQFAFKKNILLVLADLGRLDETRALLPEVRELGRVHASRLERLRLRWTEGLVFLRLGQQELAEEVLRQVREGYIAAGIGYNVALVSLDLAALYQEQGRHGEVRKLALETYPLFASRGIHREALAGWNLFRQAAERDTVTIRLLDEIASRIRRLEAASKEGQVPS